jgi:hypothetical protein
MLLPASPRVVAGLSLLVHQAIANSDFTNAMNAAMPTSLCPTPPGPTNAALTLLNMSGAFLVGIAAIVGGLLIAVGQRVMRVLRLGRGATRHQPPQRARAQHAVDVVSTASHVDESKTRVAPTDEACSGAEGDGATGGAAMLAQMRQLEETVEATVERSLKAAIREMYETLDARAQDAASQRDVHLEDTLREMMLRGEMTVQQPGSETSSARKHRNADASKGEASKADLASATSATRRRVGRPPSKKRADEDAAASQQVLHTVIYSAQQESRTHAATAMGREESRCMRLAEFSPSADREI